MLPARASGANPFFVGCGTGRSTASSGTTPAKSLALLAS
jgi:hypothetical protein